MKYLLILLVTTFSYASTAYDDSPKLTKTEYEDFSWEILQYCLKVEELAINIVYHRQHLVPADDLYEAVGDNQLASNIIADAFSGDYISDVALKSWHIVEFAAFYFNTCMERGLNET